MGVVWTAAAMKSLSNEYITVSRDRSRNYCRVKGVIEKEAFA